MSKKRRSHPSFRRTSYDDVIINRMASGQPLTPDMRERVRSVGGSDLGQRLVQTVLDIVTSIPLDDVVRLAETDEVSESMQQAIDRVTNVLLNE